MEINTHAAPSSDAKPPVAGGKPKQKNSNAHINLVVREAAAKLTRKLTEDEVSAVWKYAADANHAITSDEAVAFLLAIEQEEKKKAQATADMIGEWNKHAADLRLEATARIGTFAAMRPAIEQMQEDFRELKSRLKAKKIPADTRILPDYTWTLIETVGGKEKKTPQKGFLDFDDYCREVLKRSKQAVYKMLSDYEPAVKKDGDNSIEAITQRSGKALYNMYLKAHEVKTDLPFDAYLTSITAVAKEQAAAEARKAGKQDQKKATRLLAAKAVAGIQ